MHRISYWSLRPIQDGVPPCSLVGPTLFSVYINDIQSVESDSNVAISVYADDKIISVRSGGIVIAVRKLNTAIGLLQPWFRKWRLRINTKKCTIILFSKRLRHYRRSTYPLKIFNKNIARANQTKHLGITLDSKLRYRTHISCILLTANYRLRHLFLILNKYFTIHIN
jgi:hypothetical protein